MASDKETTPSTTVTIDMAQLAALIAATVKQTLDSQRGNANDDSLGQTIGQAVADGMAKHTRPKVPYGHYIKKIHSSLHQDPNFPSGPPLQKEVFINGIHANEHGLLDSEINLLNRLSRSGRYIDRLVEVIVGADGLEIRYNDQTNDQRNENTGKWRSMTDLLTQVVAAMDLENTEEAEAHEEKVAKRRAFGDNKAFREAKAAAAAKEGK